MTGTLPEILLFTSLAMNAALLIFIAGVLRKVMSEMDECPFKHFVGSLVRYSKKSTFMLTLFNVPFIGAIPYFYLYGFADRWLIAGSIAKAIKLPVYKAVATLEIGDVARLRKQRQVLNAVNILQAISNSVAVLIAAVSFVRVDAALSDRKDVFPGLHSLNHAWPTKTNPQCCPSGSLRGCSIDDLLS